MMKILLLCFSTVQREMHLLFTKIPLRLLTSLDLSMLNSSLLLRVLTRAAQVGLQTRLPAQLPLGATARHSQHLRKVRAVCVHMGRID